MQVQDGVALKIEGDPTNPDNLGKLCPKGNAGLSRLYDPSEGHVSFADVDLRLASLSSLRERIVVVPQEGFLFGGTVLEGDEFYRANCDVLAPCAIGGIMPCRPSRMVALISPSFSFSRTLTSFFPSRIFEMFLDFF